MHHEGYETPPMSDGNGGFGMLKRILSNIPGMKNIAVIFDFFESCGIDLNQIKKLGSGNASREELDKTITPIVYKTVPALQGALEYLEETHGTGEVGDSVLLIRNVKSTSGDVQPYVFICTPDAEGRPIVQDRFPYFKSASYILQMMEANKQRKLLAENADA